MTPDEATVFDREAEMDKREDEPDKTEIRTAYKSQSPALIHGDYTVGWICALPKEQTAATAMLDQVHPNLPKPPNDQNIYTLGLLYATIPAAKVATWISGTFPSIRVGLMVGIGGGIPPKVRLGDVVISAPVAEYPGVVQWDMGKAEEGGYFRRTGALNKPPTALLAALTKLETQHTMQGSKIHQYLDDMGKRYPRLVSRVSIDRDRDTSTLGDIRVHYGLIASGNQVIKDAKFRDRLNESLGGNVLCVEMEAAGLMNDFPCIVIRGICDYADSHKNKDWQEYAAAVAAGCAKELLDIVDPMDIEQSPEARNVMHMLQEIKSMTQDISCSQKQQMETQEEQTQNQKRRQLYKWLSPLSPSARHFENQKQRVEGTGTWLLDDPKFHDWSSTTPTCPVLCCYGAPGAGKTIISSLVIDKLKELAITGSTIGLSYMYCDYRDEKAQTTENVLGEILRQLLRRVPKIPSGVWQLYQERLEKNVDFSLADAKHLSQVISAEFSKVYVCLDALDEIGDQRHIMEVLRDRPSNMQLFLTGRPHVRETVQKYLKEVQDVLVVARDGDIQRFVDREIGGLNDAEPEAMDDELRKNIGEKVVESAKGIFLLPVLQIRAVLQNLTIRERRKSLHTLPINLSEAFTGSFARIMQQPEALSNRAAHIIAWIHLAERPLTVDGLLCSLTVKEGDRRFDVRGVPVRKTLLSCCQGLVVMDQETSAVRLVHYSLQEYLLQQTEAFKVSKREWHGIIAATCLTLLTFPPLTDGGEPTARLVQGALVAYAATQWGHHLRNNEEAWAPALELAREYLGPGWERYSDLSYLLFKEMYGWRAEEQWDRILTGHIGAFFGLPRIILYLGSTGLDLDTTDIRGRTPLLWASEEGHDAVARLLIEIGAEVDSMDGYDQTALSLASEQGHKAVVRLLIENGAIVDLRDTYGHAPLDWALKYGHKAVVRLLIEKGAAVDWVLTKRQRRRLTSLLSSSPKG